MVVERRGGNQRKHKSFKVKEDSLYFEILTAPFAIIYERVCCLWHSSTLLSLDLCSRKKSAKSV